MERGFKLRIRSRKPRLPMPPPGRREPKRKAHRKAKERQEARRMLTKSDLERY